jgi:hypothetical protein
MFIKTSICSLSFAFPDWCKVLVPTPVGPIPVPFPLVNFSFSCLGLINQFVMFNTGVPLHNVMTMTFISNGNEPSVPLGGLLSQRFCGTQRNMTCSLKVFVCGAPVTRWLDLSLQNGVIPNALGISITMSQFKYMVLT